MCESKVSQAGIEVRTGRKWQAQGTGGGRFLAAAPSPHRDGGSQAGLGSFTTTRHGKARDGISANLSSMRIGQEWRRCEPAE